MTAPYVVCVMQPSGAIEVLRVARSPVEASRACSSAVAGAHVVFDGQVVQTHPRTAAPQEKAINKALRAGTHPALAILDAPEPEPEPTPDAMEDTAEADEHDQSTANTVDALAPVAEAITAAPTAAVKPLEHVELEAAAEAPAAPNEPPHAVRVEPVKRRYTKASVSGADGGLSDLARIMRAVDAHGSIDALLEDARLGRRVRAIAGGRS